MKFVSRKGLSATEITEELADVYGHSAPSHRNVAKCVPEFNDPTRAFEDVPRSDRPPTVLTGERIRAAEESMMCMINKFLFDA